MDKYLWIGGFYDPTKRDFYVKNGHKIMSSYQSQSNILYGIEESSGISFDTINSMRIDSFPSYKKLYIHKEEWSHNGIGKDIGVAYLNAKYLSIIFRTIALKREAKRWAKNNKNNRVFVFCFGMTSPFMKACIAVNKIIKNATLIMINPDLPQFMEKDPSKFKKLLKKVDGRWINKNLSKFSKEVLYSKHMADFLNLEEHTWMVMEGSICKDDCLKLIKRRDNNITRVLYSGVVGKMYGIDKLIESFKYLDETFELVIYGSGDYNQRVEKEAQKDKRIQFYGYCDDRKKLLQAQKDADILVSLINPNDDVSKYCFPSKIFEYMMSGNIVLSSRIGGIPDDYFEYLQSIEKIEPELIAKKIIEISQLDKNKKINIGEEEVAFLIKNKMNYVQGKRIFKFIHE